MAGALLGDLGAEVIKIEQRISGDPMRGLTVRADPIFAGANRSKRGISLDLQKQEGKEVIYKLIERSDVFLHNLRPRAAKQLSLDYESLFSINPRLVYAQASGWGLQGPESEKGGFDATAAARAGLMYVTGDADTPLPQPLPSGLFDVAGGLSLVTGILAALRARDRTGRGQAVETSLFGTAITLASVALEYTLAYGTDYSRRSRANGPRNPLVNYYECADGQWIFLQMMQSDRYWSAFCEVMNIEEWEKDPRFDSYATRWDHAGELIPILDQVFATRPRSEWVKLFDERGLIYGVVQRPSDLLTDPQAIMNNYITEFDDPAFGRRKMIGPPFTFSDTPATTSRVCPEFGQHTEEVLLELGYTWDDIGRLKEQEII